MVFLSWLEQSHSKRDLKLSVLKWLSEAGTGIDTRQFNVSAWKAVQCTTNDPVLSNPNHLPFAVWTQLLTGFLGLAAACKKAKHGSLQRGSTQSESDLVLPPTETGHRRAQPRDALRLCAGWGPAAASCFGVHWADSRALGVSCATQPEPPHHSSAATAGQSAPQEPAHTPRSCVQCCLTLVHSDYLQIFTLAHGI